MEGKVGREKLNGYLFEATYITFHFIHERIIKHLIRVEATNVATAYRQEEMHPLSRPTASYYYYCMLFTAVLEQQILWERALDIALTVFGVVRQQPPKRDAPASRHFPMCDTKSTSTTPVEGCNKDTKATTKRPPF